MPIQQILLGSGAILPAEAPTNLDLSLATATTITATYTNTTDWGTPTFGIAYSTTNDANTIKTSGTVVTGASGNSTTVTTGNLTGDTTYYVLAWANSGFLKVWSSTIVSIATYPSGTTIGTAGSTYNATSTAAWAYYAVPTDKTISFYAVGGSGGAGGSWNYNGSRGGSSGSAAASYTFASGTYGSSVLLRGGSGGGGGYVGGGPYNAGCHGAGASAWMYKDTSGNWQEVVVAPGGGGGSSAWNHAPFDAGAGGQLTSSQTSTTSQFIQNGDNASNGSSSGGSNTAGVNDNHSNRNAYGSIGGYGGNGSGSSSRKSQTTGGQANSPYGNGGKTYSDEGYGCGGGGGGGYRGGAGGAYQRGGSGGSAFKMNGATPISQVLSVHSGSYNGGGHGTAGSSGSTGSSRIVIGS